MQIVIVLLCIVAAFKLSTFADRLFGRDMPHSIRGIFVFAVAILMLEGVLIVGLALVPSDL
jgi:hypothetical protein